IAQAVRAGAGAGQVVDAVADELWVGRPTAGLGRSEVRDAVAGARGELRHPAVLHAVEVGRVARRLGSERDADDGYPRRTTVTGEVIRAPLDGEETCSTPPASAAPRTSQAWPKRCSRTVVTFTGRCELPSFIIRPRVTVAFFAPMCWPITVLTPSASTYFATK